MKKKKRLEAQEMEEQEEVTKESHVEEESQSFTKEELSCDLVTTNKVKMQLTMCLDKATNKPPTRSVVLFKVYLRCSC